MNNEIITSLDNPMVKEARSLAEKKFRRFHGKFLVDGEKLVNEVVCGAAEVDKIFVDAEKLSKFDEILSRFDGSVVPVSSKVMASISENETPQGIVAEVCMRPVSELEIQEDAPLLILDRIQDPGNLGTIIRTAAATGIKNIVLIDTADAYSPKVVRSSAGGIFYTSLYRMSEAEILDFLERKKLDIYVADMGGRNIFDCKIMSRKFALVIGNEGQGASQNIKAKATGIALPMKSQMESLNASVSASVIMYVIMGKVI